MFLRPTIFGLLALSTNCNMPILISFFPTFTPFSIPLFSTYLTAPASPLVAIKNRKWARGSLYLSPLCGLNSVVGVPFIKIDIVNDLRQPSIHFMHLLQNLNLYNIYIKYMFFSKSTLRTTYSFFFYSFHLLLHLPPPPNLIVPCILGKNTTSHL